MLPRLPYPPAPRSISCGVNASWGRGAHPLDGAGPGSVPLVRGRRKESFGAAGEAGAARFPVGAAAQGTLRLPRFYFQLWDEGPAALRGGTGQGAPQGAPCLPHHLPHTSWVLLAGPGAPEHTRSATHTPDCLCTPLVACAHPQCPAHPLCHAHPDRPCAPRLRTPLRGSQLRVSMYTLTTVHTLVVCAHPPRRAHPGCPCTPAAPCPATSRRFPPRRVLAAPEGGRRGVGELKGSSSSLPRGSGTSRAAAARSTLRLRSLAAAGALRNLFHPRVLLTSQDRT